MICRRWSPAHRRCCHAREPLPPERGGYTIDEIREISRGFFGTISTELGSVIEYAFSSARDARTATCSAPKAAAPSSPACATAAARSTCAAGGTEKVYWHGPSIGTDFGASGSRTMFLIYRLHEPEALYRQFTGIDGSAYFIGGVGITFLKGGPVIMAPIRTGLGFRLGANIGYIRFTPRATWNPVLSRSRQHGRVRSPGVAVAAAVPSSAASPAADRPAAGSEEPPNGW